MDADSWMLTYGRRLFGAVPMNYPRPSVNYPCPSVSYPHMNPGAENGTLAICELGRIETAYLRQGRGMKLPENRP
eukprot:176835-Prorocentrum_minimum.AAC.1